MTISVTGDHLLDLFEIAHDSRMRVVPSNGKLFQILRKVTDHDVSI